MATVVIDLTMSLDGFIAGPGDGMEHPLGLRNGEQIFDWYMSGDQPSKDSDFFMPAGSNRKIVDEMFEQVGAMITGRRTYDITHGWKGYHPVNGIPVFILTHEPPPAAEVPQGKTKITFITDGIARAVEQAGKVVGNKKIAVGGASAAQQCLQAGLADELLVHVAPVILGDGLRLFANTGDNPIKLESTRVIEGPGITHLSYRVVKQGK